MQEIIFPKDIMIEITNNCNLNCATCYVHRDGRKKEFMSLKMFKEVIDQIPKKEEKTISLYNYGEPLMHPEISNFISYAKLKKIKHIKIATNGHFLSEKMNFNLIKAGLDYISISIDGITQKNYENFRVGGDFKFVLKNTLNLVKLRNKYSKLPVIEVQFIITKNNINDINKIKILSKKLGVDILKLKRLEVTEKKWKYLEPKGKYSRYNIDNLKNYCLKPKESIVINVDGTILPCCYITDKYIKIHNLGNIKNDKIINFLNSKKEFINQLAKDKSKIDYCKECNEGNNEIYYKVINLKG